MVQLLLRLFLLTLTVLGAARGWAQTPVSAPNSRSVSVYITAHPDDWQLFMGSDACDDVQRRNAKVVFICLTGGQANKVDDAYWQSRETACQAAVQKAANLTTAASTVPMPVQESVNAHSVTVVRYRSTVAYFLHLPDGNLDGKGQSRGGFQSMKLLFKAGRPVGPLDHGPAYTSWNDLVATVRALLQREVGSAKLEVHTPQPNERYNPGDHSDHRMAGELALAATAQTECRYQLYVGYDSSRRPLNLTATQTENQRAVYQAYSQKMAEQGQPSSWDEAHLRFIGRQYSFIRHCPGNSLNSGTPAAPSTSASGTNPDEPVEVATGIVLEPSYPNPFNESSLLTYRLPTAAAVWLRVLDSQGREVVSLLRGSQQSAGKHEQWLDVHSFPATGLYVAELRVGSQHRICRLEIIR
ncbi:PIG-L family deacetylase [Hymenobacter sp. AT01-02]|uniref:PIG-L family deacetylase n=1 Tax=Hymenobacter sp. AT01-02 TaxID=1571877 RepID=UPI0009E6E2A8|nr:PIG-L family deacetylase [Hymenobacter sp. AT01-02]